MPAFVKDEKAWAEAKAAVHKQYPKLTEEDDKFWAICNKIYHTMTKDTEKSHTRLVMRKAIVGRGEKTGGYWRAVWQRHGRFAWVSPHLVSYGEVQNVDPEQESEAEEEKQPESKENTKSFAVRFVMRQERIRHAA